MSEYKYLKDGRKVTVIGQINQSEYIVQEIFVTKDGDEIPSGEKFTTKSLLDEPMESYKAKEEKKLEDRVKSLKKEIEVLDKDYKASKLKKEALADLLRRNNYVQEALPDFDWDEFVDVMTGNMEYIVEEGFMGIEVHKFENRVYSWDSYWGDKRFNGVRSISLWTTGSGGSNECHLGNYKDLSGSSNLVVKMFKDKGKMSEYVLDLIKEKHKEGKLSLEGLDHLNGHVEAPKEIIKDLVDKRRKNLLESYDKRLEDTNRSLRDDLSKLDKYCV